MTARYVACRPRCAFIAFDEDGDMSLTADEIIVPDEAPKATGLLDANGTPLCRVRERVKFGFVP